MTFLRRALTVAEMVVRDLIRRRVALVLLTALPLAFYFVERWSEHNNLALKPGGIGMSWAVAGAALFSGLAARPLDVRLVLAGYRPTEVLVGRFVALEAVAAPLVAGFSVLLLVVSRPPDGAAVVLALILIAVVSVPLGLALSAVVPRELEGTLLLIGVIGIQMSLPSSSAAVGVLPLGGAQRLLDHAAYGQFRVGSAVARSLGWGLALLVAGAVAWHRRVRLAGARRRPAAWAGALMTSAGAVALLALPWTPASALNRGVASEVRAGPDPRRLAADATGVWVADTNAARVEHVDLSGRVTAMIPVPGHPFGLTSSPGGVWVTLPDVGRVARIDPSTYAVTTIVEIGGNPSDVVVAGGRVWLADSVEDAVVAVDPLTKEVVTRVTAVRDPVFLVAAPGVVWAGSFHDRSVTRLDATTGQVLATVGVGLRVAFGAGDASALWVSSDADSAVARVDTVSGRVVRFPLSGERPEGIALASGGAVSALSNGVVLMFSLGSGFGIRAGSLSPEGVALQSPNLWIADPGNHRIVRVSLMSFPGA